MKLTFSETLISWYKSNARDLPWRNTQDPYLIWLSEIILQQTRVAQGTPYFYQLSDAFPTVFDLAKAEEADLFRFWQGLGYYSRARNLHKTAKLVVSLGGQFPNSYAELIKLPGVGPYTAAAIASFAFNEPKPVVDGNVFRILARYFGIETDILHASARKVFTELAGTLIPHNDPATFNQAIMEFGSLQCSPVPQCVGCPLQGSCYAFAHKRVSVLPVKAKKKSQKERYFAYFIFERAGKILIKQRTSKDIWQGLWEFYLIELPDFNSLSSRLMEDLQVQASGPAWEKGELVSPPTHLLSHQKIFCKAWYVQVPDHFEISEESDYQWISPQKFNELGKSVLLLNLITDNFVLSELF